MKKTDFGKDFEWGVTICAFQNEGCPTADGKDSWSHRNIIEWFCRYVEIWINEYKDKVNNWIVMNEPMTFVGLGYSETQKRTIKDSVYGFNNS